MLIITVVQEKGESGVTIQPEISGSCKVHWGMNELPTIALHGDLNWCYLKQTGGRDIGSLL